MEHSWTEARVRELVSFARAQDPRWSWNLAMRPETAALLDLVDGKLEHPDLGYEPLVIKELDGCEVRIADLKADFVMASPVDKYGFSPGVLDGAATYWLHLPTGKLDVWTEQSLSGIET